MPDTIQTYHGSYLMPSLARATVVDAMHPGMLSCQADAPLSEVARLMATHRVHCIVIMSIAHGDYGERLAWGIISDLDLLRAGVRNGRDTTAGSLAQQPIISVNPSTPLREAGELMLAHGVTHLVVIEPDTQRPVGILSTLDVAGVLAWEER
ncbi:MAG TPA: CBS domain-containing protein [Solirubrobacteraceae bacterium]|nr:CBS domain-containing protein [Solirubrobacteraceae bacterium]